MGARLGIPLIPRVLQRISAINSGAAGHLERECRAVQMLANDLFERIDSEE